MGKSGALFKIGCFIVALAVFAAAVPVVTTAADGSSEALALGVSGLEEFRAAMEDDAVSYIRVLSGIATTRECWEGAGVPKTILGSGAAVLSMPDDGAVTLSSDTTFRDLTLEIIHTIAADGHRLIFDNGMEFRYRGSPPNLVGGGYNRDCDSGTFIQVKSGDLRCRIIAGSYQGSTYGDCYLEIGGTATVRSILGGNEGSPCLVEGSVTVAVGGGATVDGTIHGGTGSSGDSAAVGVTGPIRIDVSGQAEVTGDIYGSKSNMVSGGAAVTIRDSARVGSVYGGPDGLGYVSSLSGGTAVSVLDRATVRGDIYGGGSNSNVITVDGGTRITVADGATVSGTITGGSFYNGKNPQDRNLFYGPKLLVLERRGTPEEPLSLPVFEDIESVRADFSGLRLDSGGDGVWRELDLVDSSLHVTGDTALPLLSLHFRDSGLVLGAGSRLSAAAITGGPVQLSISGVPTDTSITAPGLDGTRLVPPPGYTLAQTGDTVTLRPTTLQVMEIEAYPTKQTYRAGEALDLTGGVLKLLFDDNTADFIPMTDPAVTAGADLSTPGTKTVQLHYGGCTAQFTVTVTDPEPPQQQLQSISVARLPTKTTYRTNESLDLTGGELTLHYTDHTTGTLSMTHPGVTLTSSPILTQPGPHTVQLEYLGFPASFPVTVTDDEPPPIRLQSISVSRLPAKTTYRTDESLDLTGGELTLHYTDGSTDALPMTHPGVALTSSPILTQPGPHTVQLEYLGFPASFPVTVTDNEPPPIRLQSISVARLPAKTAYQTNEPLDLTGGELTLHYTDGSTDTLPMDHPNVTAHCDLSTPGAKTVTLSYHPSPGLTASFQVEVTPAEPIGPPAPNPPPPEKQRRENGTTQPDPAKYFTVTANRPITLGEAKSRWRAALSGRAEGAPIVLRFVNKSHITPDVLCSVANWSAESGIPAMIVADTVENGVLLHRVSIDPSTAGGTVLLTASGKSYEAARTRSIFQAYYRNDLQVLQLSQPGGFGGEATVYTQWEPGGAPQSLRLYHYDPAANEFRSLSTTDCRLTDGGYVYFKTSTGGCLVISNGELTRR